MESYNNIFRIIVIVTVSTLVTIFITPVDSSDSFVAARSLLSDSESPAPSPDVMSPISSPENSPTEEDINSPAPAPEALADSSSSTEMENDYVAEAPSDSNASDEEDVDSPAPSPEAPAPSPDSPAPSPEASAPSSEAPAPSPEASDDSDAPANPPSEENPDEPSPNAQSGFQILSTAKNLLNPEIKTLCGKTDDPTLCESSISPLLTEKLKPDATSVLVLTIQASINATKSAIATVKKVAATDCQELYDDAVTNLEDAVKAVKSRDIGTVNTNLSAAMTDFGTCNDGFEESGEANPLGNVSDKLTKMVSNSLALSSQVKYDNVSLVM